MSSIYGDCSCGYPLEPVYFEEQEYKVISGSMIKTGRYRNAVSHLICENCGKNHCVDDTFDGKWYYKK